jgi:hypothetical protein
VAGLPHLQVLQDKYASTGVFEIIGSHVQSGNPLSLLKKKKISWTTYSQLRHKDAPCGRGIPHMVLISHKGEILKTGRVSDKDIEDAVKAARNSSPLWADVNVVLLKREAKALQLGKPIKGTLSSLASKAKTGNAIGKEAQALIDSVNQWGETEKAAIMELKNTAPSKAYGRMIQFNKTFGGMPIAKDIAIAMRVMKKDRYLPYMLSFRTQVDKFKVSKTKKDRDKKYIISRIQNFVKKYKISNALKNEAAEMVTELEAI